jgi:N-acetyl-alpha-D-muramate 1-phosphate uridylyltransferase
VRGHAGAGDFVPDEAGRLTRGPGLIYTGAQILRTDGLHAVAGDAFSLNVVWDAMIARGGVFGLVYPGHWCDVGRPASIPLAEAMLAEPDDV